MKPDTPMTWAVLVRSGSGAWNTIFVNHDEVAATTAATDRKKIRPADTVVITRIFAEVVSTTTVSVEKAP